MNRAFALALSLVASSTSLALADNSPRSAYSQISEAERNAEAAQAVRNERTRVYSSITTDNRNMLARVNALLAKNGGQAGPTICTGRQWTCGESGCDMKYERTTVTLWGGQAPNPLHNLEFCDLQAKSGLACRVSEDYVKLKDDTYGTTLSSDCKRGAFRTEETSVTKRSGF